MRNENPVIMFARVRTTVKVIRQIETHAYTDQCTYTQQVTHSTEKKRTHRYLVKCSRISSASTCWIEMSVNEKPKHCSIAVCILRIKNTQSHQRKHNTQPHRWIFLVLLFSLSLTHSFSHSLYLHIKIVRYVFGSVNAKQAK